MRGATRDVRFGSLADKPLRGILFNWLGGGSMREWWLVVLPFAIILYFIVFPDQFTEALDWLGRAIFQR